MIKARSRNTYTGTGEAAGTCCWLQGNRFEKASAVPGISEQPEEGCRITCSALCQLLQGERGRVCQEQQQSICFQSPQVQRESASLCAQKHHHSGVRYRGCSRPGPLPRMPDVFTGQGFYTAAEWRPNSLRLLHRSLRCTFCFKRWFDNRGCFTAKCTKLCSIVERVMASLPHCAASYFTLG